MNNNSQSKTFDLNKNKNNVVKIYDVDNDGSIISQHFAIYENPLGTKNNKLQNKHSFASSNPFNAVLGISSLLSSLVIPNKIRRIDVYGANDKYSINEAKIKESTLSNLENYKNTILEQGNIKSIFDFKSKNNLFIALNKELLESDNIRNHINDDNYWIVLENELTKRNVWKNTLSDVQKNIVTKITGINFADSLLYDLFKNEELVKNKVLGFKNYLENKYGRIFAEFVNFLMTSTIVKDNIYSYNSFKNIDQINLLHPNFKVYEKLEKADSNDIKFLKNKFFNTTEVSKVFEINALDKNSIYKKLTNINAIFGQNITSQEELNDYIDKNSTINNLENLLHKINLEFDIYNFRFRNNVNNNFIVSRGIQIESVLKYKWNILYIGLFCLITVYMFVLINKKIKKGDLI